MIVLRAQTVRNIVLITDEDDVYLSVFMNIDHIDQSVFSCVRECVSEWFD